ncbi:winged helix-turn-helix transcriptional regulator [Pseudonocardia kunmingensis]|uniref:HxlR family transcriptional regulator n=1 Tax=Pseudonocardia kunmingensis TaxID=630975 RepID=A0A543E016_9PSEU|nr:winged helix-turn-helix transcriptional regulator [Pseudonocardia kunmingensis]TQM14925.1 HxlR family transcriptional regulator [Pseudonocardia kunmingensis]
MAGARHYDDPCGVARALDLVGERWTLLVVRELLFGPKRFSDLVRGLPGMSQNVLSQRLRELGGAGIVERRRLGPPVSGQVYELTERGAALRPVVIELARWGSRVPTTSRADLSADALALALLTTFDAEDAEDVRITLRLGDDAFAATVSGGRLEIVRGTVERPDAEVGTDAAGLRTVVFGGRTLSEAVAAGDVEVTGDEERASRFLRRFPRPAPVGS